MDNVHWEEQLSDWDSLQYYSHIWIRSLTKIIDNYWTKFRWDIRFLKDKQLLVIQLDIVGWPAMSNSYVYYTTVVIVVVIPAINNTTKKEYKKIDKYQGLKEQLQQMWKVKSEVILVVIGALWGFFCCCFLLTDIFYIQNNMNSWWLCFFNRD